MTNNPFDMNNFFNSFNAFDRNAVTQQFMNMFGQYKAPNVDMSAVTEAQRKNLEALAAANKSAIEGTRLLMQRQAEMIQKAMSEATAAAQSLASSKDPAEAAEKQTKLMEEAMSQAIANATEISELVTKTQDETAKVINDRVTQGMEELKANMAKYSVGF